MSSLIHSVWSWGLVEQQLPLSNLPYMGRWTRRNPNGIFVLRFTGVTWKGGDPSEEIIRTPQVVRCENFNNQFFILSLGTATAVWRALGNAQSLDPIASDGTVHPCSSTVGGFERLRNSISKDLKGPETGVGGTNHNLSVVF